MKRRLSLFVLIIMLLPLPAKSETNNMAFIKASTSDRVHLREGKGTTSTSLGLYFTGTPVFVLENSKNSEWVYVLIGAEKGYVRSDLLLSANDYLSPRWKIAQVSVSGGVNLRCAPTKEAPVIKTVPNGSSVIVLGETSDKWCYVKYGSIYGYIMSRYLSVSSQEVSEVNNSVLNIPLKFPADLSYSSGAGAWSTEMTVFADGSFWGYFHDTDMGSYDVGYPNGTRYEGSFTGQFSNVQKISDYEYQMKVQVLQSFGIVDQEIIEDGIRIIISESFGLSQNEVFSLYLPDMPDERLPSNASFWRRGYRFDFYEKDMPSILYGHSNESVWRVY